MPHVHRFHIPTGSATADTMNLSGDEAHHALRVVRVRVGDPVELFDGRGRVLSGEVAELGKRDATIAVKEERREAEPPRLTLAQAWLHRDKAVETLLRRGTELGVTRFLFFRGQHSERAPKHSAKWERLAMDVCKQCGRNWLPAFEIAEDMEAALAAMSGTALVATAECEAAPLAGQVHGDVPVGVLVGPEGDFSPEELHFALAAGHNPLSLGATTFRAEVAGIVAATLVQYERGLLGPR